MPGTLASLAALLITVTVNALRHGDMVVEAAESRGFSATLRQGKTIGWRSGDLALTGVLAAASAMLLAV